MTLTSPKASAPGTITRGAPASVHVTAAPLPTIARIATVAPGCRTARTSPFRAATSAPCPCAPASASAWTPRERSGRQDGDLGGPQGDGDWSRAVVHHHPQGEELRVPGEQEAGGQRGAGAEARARVPEIRRPCGDGFAAIHARGGGDERDEPWPHR